jgi:hypothetical protein
MRVVADEAAVDVMEAKANSAAMQIDKVQQRIATTQAPFADGKLKKNVKETRACKKKEAGPCGDRV